MKNIIVTFMCLLYFTGCKKTYVCHCYSERRGFLYEEQTYTYTEKSKNDAFVKCTNEYKTSANYMGGYCEIK